MKSFFVIIILLFIVSITKAQTKMYINKITGDTVAIQLDSIKSISFKTSPIGPVGLIAWFPFNGNANDSSGNGNNAVVYGPTLAPDRFNQNNKAYQFTGANDSIKVTNTAILNSYQQATICAWVFYQSGGTDNPRIVVKGANIFELMIFQSGGNKISIHHGSDATRYDADSTYNLNAWNFVVVTKNGTQMKVYKNGNLSNTFTVGSAALPSSNYPIIFGARSDGGLTDRFVGKLDDIRIYNRVLTDVEIQSYYHEGGW